jgi:hypothetical protein
MDVSTPAASALSSAKRLKKSEPMRPNQPTSTPSRPSATTVLSTPPTVTVSPSVYTSVPSAGNWGKPVKIRSQK